MLTKKLPSKMSAVKKMALGALVTAMASQAYAETVTVVSFGGLNKDAHDKAFYKPFAACSGILNLAT